MKWVFLYLAVLILACWLSYTMGRMTAPDLELAYQIQCTPEQMEQVKRVAGDYRAQGRSVVSALTKARMEVCL